MNESTARIQSINGDDMRYTKGMPSLIGVAKSKESADCCSAASDTADLWELDLGTWSTIRRLESFISGLEL